MRIVLAAKPDADLPWLIDAVARLAKQTSASVTVVVVDDVELERLSPSPRAVFVQAATETAARATAQLTEAGIEAGSVVLPGRPLDRIVSYADQQQADLIVVGASSRPAVAERLLGSVPLELIKKSSRPVLVVTRP